MKLGVSLKTSQNLALTPQLQQAIRLLQLSTLEMQQEVEHMLEENPFLELQEGDGNDGFDGGHASLEAPPAGGIAPEPGRDGGHDGAAEEGDATGQAQGSEEREFEAVPEDWSGDGSMDISPNDGEWGSDAPAPGAAGAGDEVDAADINSAHLSLADFLHQQAGEFFLDAVDRCALDFLIESLNEDGYLEDTLEDLALPLARSLADVDELLHHFQLALNLLHTMEPAGVGARDLAECLQLQLRALQRDERCDCEPALLTLAQQLCQQPLELLAKRDVRQLCQLTQAEPEQVRDALLLIARLEPKPGRRFADVERNAIVPDVLVHAAQPGQQRSAPSSDFVVRINPDVMPRLRVHEVYAQALRGSSSHAELQQRVQEARWFIKNIQQRFDTILRVSKAIVARQHDFFVHGPTAMRPLVLRDIAQELGMHESTISRVTTAKYMATPQGTFELKYFFGSGLETDSGASASSTAVRALIKQWISAEDPSQPLSDSQIANLLKEQGIECARRTVAKYREALRIAPANLRKSL
ncbi:RNA polymerase sigma-54 factor [Vandammella animalimorsus]|uniref:RNA polymerase sigma-54 factor n=1 Tax=Vandammella animalimorsus TaxID=2029117 RepID=A0A3M6RQM2_9BURK|nr:RNA polymerase factor sigma-54 [Vandammella animalimorsus]RMX17506.1 RNA polymerase sigma-54 factor [Vandammella animalimorsus]